MFGGQFGHSADLMALPSNVQCALDGSPLPFVSPHPTPGSSGVNVLAQLLANHDDLFSNPYVFPAIVLIPHILRFVRSQSFPCTVVIPDVWPRKFWWPLLQSLTSILGTSWYAGCSSPPPLLPGLFLLLPPSLGPVDFPRLSPLVLLNLRFLTLCYHMPT